MVFFRLTILDGGSHSSMPSIWEENDEALCEINHLDLIQEVFFDPLTIFLNQIKILRLQWFQLNGRQPFSPILNLCLNCHAIHKAHKFPEFSCYLNSVGLGRRGPSSLGCKCASPAYKVNILLFGTHRAFRVLG